MYLACKRKNTIGTKFGCTGWLSDRVERAVYIEETHTHTHTKHALHTPRVARVANVVARLEHSDARARPLQQWLLGGVCRVLSACFERGLLVLLLCVLWGYTAVDMPLPVMCDEVSISNIFSSLTSCYR